METLITSYGIDFLPFQLTINSLDGLVAGSSALAAYLAQEGIEPGFQPNDLDIFIPGSLSYVRDMDGCIITGQYVIKSLKTMKDFLAPYGFTENDKFGTLDAPTEGYYSSLNKIQKVTSFTNKHGKEIQVIVIGSYNLVEHISKDFDLSVCISWWDARNNTFKTMDPDSTKRKEMYIVRQENTAETEEKTKKRIEKYASRAFKLIDKPCSFIDMRDPRDQLYNKKFNDIEVMDIFTLDEISIREHLQKSDWNIVLKAGEAYYAFNRKSLMDYMKKKSSNIGRIGQVYETPFNQCITLEGYHQLRYADYSIYELKNAYSVPTYGGRVKSLFHLSCYSIQEWIDGKEGGIVEMPPQHLTMSAPNIKRIIRRGEPLPPQVGARAHLPELAPDRSNIQEVINVSIDDILAAHAHLMVPGNLEAFHTAVREINGEI
jgi:hypothetical protein